MATLKELHVLRGAIKGRITRFQRYIEQFIDETVTDKIYHEISLRLSAVEEFLDCQYKIEIQSDDPTQEELYRDEFESNYFQVCSIAKNLVSDYEKLQSGSVSIQTGIRLCHLNIRSLRNKADELDVILHDLNFPEIICLSEVWCNNDELMHINLTGYELSDYSTRSNKKGGGVAVFIKSGIAHTTKLCKIVKTESIFEYALTTVDYVGNKVTVELMDKAFPTVYYPVNRNSKRKPWLSKEILEQGRLLREIHAACKYTMSIELLERYKTLKASHRLKIQVAKKLYHDNTMRNSLNKSKTAWNIIKQHTGGSRTDNQNVDFRKDDGSILAGKDLADAFNNYFLESVQALTQNININSAENTNKACWQVVNQMKNKSPSQRNTVLRSNGNEKIEDPVMDWKRPLKLHELLEEIRNLENDPPSNIVIFSPEIANNENTDEDSGNEEDVILNNLSGSQLLAVAEVLHDSTAADIQITADATVRMTFRCRLLEPELISQYLYEIVFSEKVEVITSKYYPKRNSLRICFAARFEKVNLQIPSTNNVNKKAHRYPLFTNSAV
nr:unnamed protein product [Callosobruchus chinensis]